MSELRPYRSLINISILDQCIPTVALKISSSVYFLSSHCYFTLMYSCEAFFYTVIRLNSSDWFDFTKLIYSFLSTMCKKCDMNFWLLLHYLLSLLMILTPLWLWLCFQNKKPIICEIWS